MKIIKLITGIFLFALGIVVTINANMGIAPWDTFHQGVSLHSPLSFGQASIVIGLSILVINYLIGEKIGLGTLLNIVGIGLIIDWLFLLKIVPQSQEALTGFLMMTI